MFLQFLIVVQSLNCVQLFVTLITATLQASLSFTISQSLLTLMSIRCHPTISSYSVPFAYCLQSFPASGSFAISHFFTSGGQRIGASAPALPMNIQAWFPLGLTGLISSQSKGLQESSPAPQMESIKSSALSLLYSLTHTSVCDYLKNQSFD